MSNTALITGASAGIGREFARYHASKGGDLIITARRADALTALKTELETAHGISVTTIPQDLSSADHAKTLYAALNGTRIDVLINNAGFGGHGKFIERDLSADFGHDRPEHQRACDALPPCGRRHGQTGRGQNPERVIHRRPHAPARCKPRILRPKPLCPAFPKPSQTS